MVSSFSPWELPQSDNKNTLSPLPRKNAFFILFTLIGGFFAALFGSVRLFFASLFSPNTRPLRENEFLKVMDFTLNAGPRNFWRFPTAIKIGRSIGTLLHFVFNREQTFKIKKPTDQKKGFTLIELMVSITILAFVILIAYSALQYVSISWFTVSGRINLNRDLYYATEKVVSLVKDGGSIDYEEYWDRYSIGTSTFSWHYAQFTGFGNYGSGGDMTTADYGDGYYLCRSNSGTNMTHTGCLENDFNTYTGSVKGKPQRYGQYALQFTNYNSDADGDGGDMNGDGKIYNDSDDAEIWEGPVAFESDVSIPELYLIKKWQSSQERTYFRRIFERDPDAPASASCDSKQEGSGCFARLQILRLVGEDLGLSHTGKVSITSSWRYDGMVDTWVCASDFKCSWPGNMPIESDITSATGAWVDLFPHSVNVKKLEFYPFPDKDTSLAWQEDAPSAGSIRLILSVGYSWWERKRLAFSDPTITVTTTVNLNTQ